MKLILTHTVDGLGEPGDVVDVKDGYARNLLLPRGLGVKWTRAGQKQVDSMQAARKARAVRDVAHADQLKTALEEGPVDLKVRAGDTGRLFGSVTPTDVADAMAAKIGEPVDKRSVIITDAIKSLGAHSVQVRLHEGVDATVALNVIPAK